MMRDPRRRSPESSRRPRRERRDDREQIAGSTFSTTPGPSAQPQEYPYSQSKSHPHPQQHPQSQYSQYYAEPQRYPESESYAPRPQPYHEPQRYEDPQRYPQLEPYAHPKSHAEPHSQPYHERDRDVEALGYGESEKMRPRGASSSSASSSTSSSFLNISAKGPRFGGVFSTFWRAPSENRKKRRKKKQKARILSFGNSSSSSVNSDLAYGRGYIERDKSQLTTPMQSAYASPAMHMHQQPVQSRQEPEPAPRDKTDEEILSIGRQLQDIARRQNDADMRAASKSGTSQLAGAAGIAGAAAAFSHFRKKKPDARSRGAGSSKVKDKGSSSDDDWESASDDESSTDSSESSDAGLVYGSDMRPSKSARISSEPPEQIKPPGHKNTVVDPRLFGPYNSLRGAVKSPCGFGEEDPRSAGSFRRHHEETVAQVQSPKTRKQPMQHVYPMPTSDPNRFDFDRGSVTSFRQELPQQSRPAPVPLQQPIPIAPVSSKVYDADRFVEDEPRASKRQPANGRSAAENAIAGVGFAAAAIGVEMATRRDSLEYLERRDNRRSEFRERHDDHYEVRGKRQPEERTEPPIRIELEDREPRGQRDPRRPNRRNDVEIIDEGDKVGAVRDPVPLEPAIRQEVGIDSRPEVYKLPRGDEIRVEYDPDEERRRREAPTEARKDDRKPHSNPAAVDECRDAKRVEKPSELPRDYHGVEQPEVPITQAPIDPFQFQVADDAFQTPKYATPKNATPKRPLTPQVVTVDREPNFDDSPPRKPDYSEARMSRKDSFELEKRLEQYQHQSFRDRSRTPEPRRRRDSLEENEHAAKSIYDEAKHATAPLAAAAIASAIAVEEERSRRHRGGHVTEYDPRDRSQAAKDAVQEEADRYYRETVLARKIAEDEIRSRSSSPHDKSVVGKWQDHDGPEVVTIVTPPEMDHPHAKSPYDAPNADVRIDHVIIPTELHRFRLPDGQLASGSTPTFKSRDPSCDHERPLLNLVLPTPMVTPRATPAPEQQTEARSKRDTVRPISVETREAPTDTAPEIILGPKGEVIERPATPAAKSVTWGENETKSFEVESPEPPKSTSPTASTKSKSKKRFGKSSPWGIIAAAVGGAGAAAAASSAAAPEIRDPFQESKPEDEEATHSPPQSPKSRAIESCTEPPVSPQLVPSFDDEQDLPPAPGPKPSSSPSRQMPGAFADDIEFASVLAAGLQDTGFDPNIVIDNPTYMKRDSPPRQSEPLVYQQPFAETVTDLGAYGHENALDSSARREPVFVIGEVPETPAEEKDLYNVPHSHSLSPKEERVKGKAKETVVTDEERAGDESQPTRKLSKKEKRKQKAAKRQSGDDTPFEVPRDAPEPESASTSKVGSQHDSQANYKDVPNSPETIVAPGSNSRDIQDAPAWNLPAYSPRESSFEESASASYPQGRAFDDQPYSKVGSSYGERAPHSTRPFEEPASLSRTRSLDEPSSLHSGQSFNESESARPDETPLFGSTQPGEPPVDYYDTATPTKSSKKEKKKKRNRSSRSNVIVVQDDDGGPPEDYVVEGSRTSRQKLPERDDFAPIARRENDDDPLESPKKKEKSKKSKQSSDEWTDVERQVDDASVDKSTPIKGTDDWDDRPAKSRRDRSKFEDNDVSSVVSDPSSRREKSYLRSNGSKYEDDDVKSVASDGISRERRSRDYKKSPKDEEKRSSSSFFSLFRPGSGNSKEPSVKDEKSFLDNAGTLGAGAGLASAVAALGSMMSRSNATEPQSEELSDIHRSLERSASPPRDMDILDPEITQRVIRPAIDPQYGDLLPLPPSPMPPSTAGSLTRELDELPALPDSRPETPPNERRRQREMKTHVRRRSNLETPHKSPSQTAVPIKLRLGQRSAPSSPGNLGQPVSPVSPPILPTAPEPTLSRRPSARPISWERGSEFKPLYLLEHARQAHAAQSVEPPIDFPELPPSEPPSRESPAPAFALRENDIDYFELQPSPFEPEDLRINTDVSQFLPSVVDQGSRDTTPKAEQSLQHTGAIFGSETPALPTTSDTAQQLHLSEHEQVDLPALPDSPAGLLTEHEASRPVYTASRVIDDDSVELPTLPTSSLTKVEPVEVACGTMFVPASPALPAIPDAAGHGDHFEQELTNLPALPASPVGEQNILRSPLLEPMADHSGEMMAALPNSPVIERERPASPTVSKFLPESPILPAMPNIDRRMDSFEPELKELPALPSSPGMVDPVTKRGPSAPPSTANFQPESPALPTTPDAARYIDSSEHQVENLPAIPPSPVTECGPPAATTADKFAPESPALPVTQVAIRDIGSLETHLEELPALPASPVSEPELVSAGIGYLPEPPALPPALGAARQLEPSGQELDKLPGLPASPLAEAEVFSGNSYWPGSPTLPSVPDATEQLGIFEYDLNELPSLPANPAVEPKILPSVSYLPESPILPLVPDAAKQLDITGWDLDELPALPASPVPQAAVKERELELIEAMSKDRDTSPRPPSSQSPRTQDKAETMSGINKDKLSRTHTTMGDLLGGIAVGITAGVLASDEKFGDKAKDIDIDAQPLVAPEPATPAEPTVETNLSKKAKKKKRKNKEVPIHNTALPSVENALSSEPMDKDMSLPTRDVVPLSSTDKHQLSLSNFDPVIPVTVPTSPSREQIASTPLVDAAILLPPTRLPLPNPSEEEASWSIDNDGGPLATNVAPSTPVTAPPADGEDRVMSPVSRGRFGGFFSRFQPPHMLLLNRSKYGSNPPSPYGSAPPSPGFHSSNEVKEIEEPVTQLPLAKPLASETLPAQNTSAGSIMSKVVDNEVPISESPISKPENLDNLPLTDLNLTTSAEYPSFAFEEARRPLLPTDNTVPFPEFSQPEKFTTAIQNDKGPLTDTLQKERDAIPLQSSTTIIDTATTYDVPVEEKLSKKEKKKLKKAQAQASELEYSLDTAEPTSHVHALKQEAPAEVELSLPSAETQVPLGEADVKSPHLDTTSPLAEATISPLEIETAGSLPKTETDNPVAQSDGKALPDENAASAPLPETGAMVQIPAVELQGPLAATEEPAWWSRSEQPKGIAEDNAEDFSEHVVEIDQPTPPVQGPLAENEEPAWWSRSELAEQAEKADEVVEVDQIKPPVQGPLAAHEELAWWSCVEHVDQTDQIDQDERAKDVVETEQVAPPVQGPLAENEEPAWWSRSDVVEDSLVEQQTQFQDIEKKVAQVNELPSEAQLPFVEVGKKPAHLKESTIEQLAEVEDTEVTEARMEELPFKPLPRIFEQDEGSVSFEGNVSDPDTPRPAQGYSFSVDDADLWHQALEPIPEEPADLNDEFLQTQVSAAESESLPDMLKDLTIAQQTPLPDFDQSTREQSSENLDEALAETHDPKIGQEATRANLDANTLENPLSDVDNTFQEPSTETDARLLSAPFSSNPSEKQKKNGEKNPAAEEETVVTEQNTLFEADPILNQGPQDADTNTQLADQPVSAAESQNSNSEMKPEEDAEKILVPPAGDTTTSSLTERIGPTEPETVVAPPVDKPICEGPFAACETLDVLPSSTNDGDKLPSQTTSRSVEPPDGPSQLEQSGKKKKKKKGKGASISQLDDDVVSTETTPVQTPIAETSIFESPLGALVNVAPVDEILVPENPVVETPTVETPTGETTVETAAAKIRYIEAPSINDPTPETINAEPRAVDAPLGESTFVDIPFTKTSKGETAVETCDRDTPAVNESVVETSGALSYPVGTPVVQDPLVETQLVETPTGEATVEFSSDDKVVGETSMSDISATRTPAVQNSTVETPLAEAPANNTSVAQNVVSETESPHAHSPAVEAPVIENLVVETPVVETPTSELPFETPGVEYPMAETRPLKDMPENLAHAGSAEAVLTHIPAVETPVIGNQVVETPSVETPTSEIAAETSAKNTEVDKAFTADIPAETSQAFVETPLVETPIAKDISVESQPVDTPISEQTGEAFAQPTFQESTSTDTIVAENASRLETDRDQRQGTEDSAVIVDTPETLHISYADNVDQIDSVATPAGEASKSPKKSKKKKRKDKSIQIADSEPSVFISGSPIVDVADIAQETPVPTSKIAAEEDNTLAQERDVKDSGSRPNNSSDLAKPTAKRELETIKTESQQPTVVERQDDAFVTPSQSAVVPEDQRDVFGNLSQEPTLLETQTEAVDVKLEQPPAENDHNGDVQAQTEPESPVESKKSKKKKKKAAAAAAASLEANLEATPTNEDNNKQEAKDEKITDKGTSITSDKTGDAEAPSQEAPLSGEFAADSKISEETDPGSAVTKKGKKQKKGKKSSTWDPETENSPPTNVPEHTADVANTMDKSAYISSPRGEPVSDEISSPQADTSTQPERSYAADTGEATQNSVTWAPVELEVFSNGSELPQNVDNGLETPSEDVPASDQQLPTMELSRSRDQRDADSEEGQAPGSRIIDLDPESQAQTDPVGEVNMAMPQPQPHDISAPIDYLPSSSGLNDTRGSTNASNSTDQASFPSAHRMLPVTASFSAVDADAANRKGGETAEREHDAEQVASSEADATNAEHAGRPGAMDEPQVGTNAQTGEVGLTDPGLHAAVESANGQGCDKSLQDTQNGRITGAQAVGPALTDSALEAGTPQNTPVPTLANQDTNPEIPQPLVDEVPSSFEVDKKSDAGTADAAETRLDDVKLHDNSIIENFDEKKKDEEEQSSPLATDAERPGRTDTSELLGEALISEPEIESPSKKLPDPYTPGVVNITHSSEKTETEVQPEDEVRSQPISPSNMSKKDKKNKKTKAAGAEPTPQDDIHEIKAQDVDDPPVVQPRELAGAESLEQKEPAGIPSAPDVFPATEAVEAGEDEWTVQPVGKKRKKDKKKRAAVQTAEEAAREAAQMLETPEVIVGQGSQSQPLEEADGMPKTNIVEEERPTPTAGSCESLVETPGGMKSKRSKRRQSLAESVSEEAPSTTNPIISAASDIATTDEQLDLPDDINTIDFETPTKGKKKKQQQQDLGEDDQDRFRPVGQVRPRFPWAAPAALLAGNYRPANKERRFSEPTEAAPRSPSITSVQDDIDLNSIHPRDALSTLSDSKSIDTEVGTFQRDKPLQPPESVEATTPAQPAENSVMDEPKTIQQASSDVPKETETPLQTVTETPGDITIVQPEDEFPVITKDKKKKKKDVTVEVVDEQPTPLEPESASEPPKVEAPSEQPVAPETTDVSQHMEAVTETASANTQRLDEKQAVDQPEEHVEEKTMGSLITGEKAFESKPAADEDFAPVTKNSKKDRKKKKKKKAAAAEAAAQEATLDQVIEQETVPSMAPLPQEPGNLGTAGKDDSPEIQLSVEEATTADSDLTPAGGNISETVIPEASKSQDVSHQEPAVTSEHGSTLSEKESEDEKKKGGKAQEDPIADLVPELQSDSASQTREVGFNGPEATSTILGPPSTPESVPKDLASAVAEPVLEPQISDPNPPEAEQSTTSAPEPIEEKPADHPVAIYSADTAETGQPSAPTPQVVDEDFPLIGKKEERAKKKKKGKTLDLSEPQISSEPVAEYAERDTECLPGTPLETILQTEQTCEWPSTTTSDVPNEVAMEPSTKLADNKDPVQNVEMDQNSPSSGTDISQEKSFVEAQPAPGGSEAQTPDILDDGPSTAKLSKKNKKKGKKGKLPDDSEIPSDVASPRNETQTTTIPDSTDTLQETIMSELLTAETPIDEEQPNEVPISSAPRFESPVAQDDANRNFPLEKEPAQSLQQQGIDNQQLASSEIRTLAPEAEAKIQEPLAVEDSEEFGTRKSKKDKKKKKAALGDIASENAASSIDQPNNAATTTPAIEVHAVDPLYEWAEATTSKKSKKNKKKRRSSEVEPEVGYDFAREGLESAPEHQTTPTLPADNLSSSPLQDIKPGVQAPASEHVVGEVSSLDPVTEAILDPEPSTLTPITDTVAKKSSKRLPVSEEEHEIHDVSKDSQTLNVAEPGLLEQPPTYDWPDVGSTKKARKDKEKKRQLGHTEWASDTATPKVESTELRGFEEGGLPQSIPLPADEVVVNPDNDTADILGTPVANQPAITPPRSPESATQETSPDAVIARGLIADPVITSSEAAQRSLQEPIEQPATVDEGLVEDLVPGKPQKHKKKNRGSQLEPEEDVALTPSVAEEPPAPNPLSDLTLENNHREEASETSREVVDTPANPIIGGTLGLLAAPIEKQTQANEEISRDNIITVGNSTRPTPGPASPSQNLDDTNKIDVLGETHSSQVGPDSSNEPVEKTADEPAVGEYEWDMHATKKSRQGKNSKRESFPNDLSSPVNVGPTLAVDAEPRQSRDDAGNSEYFDKSILEDTRSASAPPSPEPANTPPTPTDVPERIGNQDPSPEPINSAKLDLHPAQESSSVIHDAPFDQSDQRKKLKTREQSETLLPERILSPREIAAAYPEDDSHETKPAEQDTQIPDEPSPHTTAPYTPQEQACSSLQFEGDGQKSKSLEDPSARNIATSYLESKTDYEAAEKAGSVRPVEENRAADSPIIEKEAGAAAIAAVAALATKSSGKQEGHKNSKSADKCPPRDVMSDDASLWQGVGKKHVSEPAIAEVGQSLAHDGTKDAQRAAANVLEDNSFGFSNPQEERKSKQHKIAKDDDVFAPRSREGNSIPIPGRDTDSHLSYIPPPPIGEPSKASESRSPATSPEQTRRKTKDMLSFTAPIKEMAQDDNIESPVLGREVDIESKTPAEKSVSRSLSTSFEAPDTSTMTSDLDEAVDRGYEAESRRDLASGRPLESPFRSPVPSLLPPVQEEAQDDIETRSRSLPKTASRRALRTPEPQRDSGLGAGSPHPFRRSRLDNQEGDRDNSVLGDWWETTSQGRDARRTPELSSHRERRRSRELERVKSPVVKEVLRRSPFAQEEPGDLPLSRTPILGDPSGRELTPTPEPHKMRRISPELERKRSKYQDLASAALAGAAISSTSSPRSTPPAGNRSVSERVARLQSPAPVDPPSVARRSISNSSLSRHRRAMGSVTPEPLKFRPESPGISRPATATPPLRRADRRVSGDLRSLSQRSHQDLSKDPTPTGSSNTPVANEGRVRTKDMADVYDGFGEGRIGSPRSPTRPHSMRRRQSMQVLELESRVEQLMAENRMLADARTHADSHSSNNGASGILAERDAEIDVLKQSLEFLQKEVARLTEVNEGLNSANAQLAAQHNERYRSLETQHADASRQLHEARSEQSHFQESLSQKDAEIGRLRSELDAAKDKIRQMQRQILAAKGADADFLNVKDVDHFDHRCQQLCSHVQQWVLRFSKFSDMRACRLTNEINDEKVIDRLDNAILDGTDVDAYLADRVRRRDVFMSMTMNMIWEFVFTRYLFGMDREQRQKLKSLEKLLTEVGPPQAVRQWRAVTLTLLSKRPSFKHQRDLDTEAVVQAIFQTLSRVLPPPSNLEDQIQSQLRRVMREAVDLSVEMRTQRAEYMMLPPLQPEYDADGELAETVTFNAALMNERSGDKTVTNEELEAQNSTVRIVLFPLVVKKGDDAVNNDDEIVVCPAQVLVARSKVKSARLFAGSDAGGASVVGGNSAAAHSDLSMGTFLPEHASNRG